MCNNTEREIKSGNQIGTVIFYNRANKTGSLKNSIGTVYPFGGVNLHPNTNYLGAGDQVEFSVDEPTGHFAENVEFIEDSEGRCGDEECQECCEHGDIMDWHCGYCGKYLVDEMSGAADAIYERMKGE